MVLDKLPGMVGRKFKYVQVSRDHRAAELADALRHLCMARVACKVHHTAANGVPLAAEVDERRLTRPWRAGRQTMILRFRMRRSA